MIFKKQPLNRNGVDSKTYKYELNIQLYASVYEYVYKTGFARKSPELPYSRLQGAAQFFRDVHRGVEITYRHVTCVA